MDDRGLGRIRGYSWVTWMSKTTEEPHIEVQRYHKYSLQDHKSFIQELGRKFSYSHLYRRLLLLSGQPPVPFLLITGTWVYKGETPSLALEHVGLCGAGNILGPT